MPAPDLRTLFAVEKAVQSAWARILRDAGFAPFEQGDDANLTPGADSIEGAATTPRVEVKCEITGSTGHLGQYAPGHFCEDAWSGRLSTGIVTTRTRDSAAMEDAIAIVRMEAQYFRDRFNATLLPFHAVTMVRDMGAQRGIDAQEDADRTEFMHDILVSVRAGAWPS